MPAMPADNPTPSSLAKQLENIDAEIKKTNASIGYHQDQLRISNNDLHSQEAARGAIVAQLAVMIGIVKPRTSRGVRVPTIAALTEEELQQADIAVNGAVKEISEEVNRSGRE